MPDQTMADFNDDARRVAIAMQTWGGGFVKALGVAIIKADNSNRHKHNEAFPEFWEEYWELACVKGVL